MNRGSGAGDGADRWVAAMTLAAFATIALPPLACWMPPLLDYPNHYARLWLIAEGLEGGPASGMYALDWSSSWTNIGIDLMAWALGPLAPTGVIGRLAVTAAVVLPPMGAWSLNRRIFGPGKWWAAVVPAAAWTATLIAGFLNYQIALGLALLAAAVDGRLGRWRLAWRLAISLGLIAFHAFGLFLYAAALCGLALGADLRPLRSPRSWPGLMARLIEAAAAPVTAVALFWWLAPMRPTGAMVFIDLNWSNSLYLVFSAIGTYDLRIDQALMAIPALLLVTAAVTRRLKAHAGLAVAAALVLIATLAAPAAAGGAYWVNQRLPIMALLLLLAAVDPQLEGSVRWARVLAAACLAIVAARTAYVAEIWARRQGDFRALERLAVHIPPGAAVLTLQHEIAPGRATRRPSGRRSYGGVANMNDAVLLLPLRHAFTPLLFAKAGQQPVRVLPPWSNIAAPTSPPAGVHALDGGGDGAWRQVAGYAACWRTHFDYAVVTNADEPDRFGPARLPRELTLVADEGYARLYRIDRAGPRGPNPAPCPPPS